MGEQKTTVGRIVHYVLDEQDGSMAHKVGEHRPAMIVKCWSETCVQLQVFMDGTNDRLDGNGLVWVTSVSHDEDAKNPRTWHWPERD